MEETLSVPVEKVGHYAGMVFLSGLEAIGATHRREEEIWFQKRSWERLAALFNEMPDGEYTARGLAEKCRRDYLEPLEVSPVPVLLPGELIVWEAVARAIFEVIEEGELLPEHQVEDWVEWVKNKFQLENPA